MEKLLFFVLSACLFFTGCFPTSASLPEMSSSIPSEYRAFYQELVEYRASGAVNCNTTFRSAPHLMLCNCANESAYESDEGQQAVARVVFSRAKSPYFPSTVMGVICQRRAFSWMNNAFNSSCQRLPGRSAPLLNHRTIREPVLTKCFNNIARAAELELVEHPNEIWALNYCNPRVRGVASWCRRFPNSRGMVDRVGNHYFGFERVALMHQESPAPPRNIVKIPGVKFLFSLFMPEKSYAGTFEVDRTYSTEKVILDRRLQQVLAKKYKNFKIYDPRKYEKATKVFLKQRSKTSPSTIVGDYNGDGYKDVIFLGSDQGNERIVAFMSKGLNKYKDYSVSYYNRDRKPHKSYFVNLAKSEIQFKSGVQKQAWQVEQYGGAFMSFYFDGEKIKLNDDQGYKFKERKNLKVSGL